MKHSDYIPVAPKRHEQDCRRGSRPWAPGTLDVQRCARCAELWRRVGARTVMS